MKMRNKTQLNWQNEKYSIACLPIGNRLSQFTSNTLQSLLFFVAFIQAYSFCHSEDDLSNKYCWNRMRRVFDFHFLLITVIGCDAAKKKYSPSNVCAGIHTVVHLEMSSFMPIEHISMLFLFFLLLLHHVHAFIENKALCA